MSLLDALLGIREVLYNGVAVASSRSLNFKGDARAVFNALTGKTDVEVIAGSTAPADTVADTTYTFALADLARRKKFTAETTVTATVPPASSVDWPVDAVIYPVQYGAGQVVIAAGDGVTINIPPSFLNNSLEQYSTLVLTYEGSDVWTLGGLLEAGEVVPEETILYGGSGWDTTNILTSGVAAGVRGHASNGLWTAVLFSADEVPSGTGYFASSFAGGGDGWRMFHVGAALSFDINSGGIAVPTRTIVADDLNKLQLWVCQWDTTHVRSYFGRAQVGSGTVAASYTISAGTERMSIGTRNNDTAPAHSGITIYGFAGGNTALTLGEIEAMFDAVEAGGDIVAIPGKTTALYSVTQDRVDANFPNGLEDKVGSADLTFVAGAASGIVLETATDMPYGW